MGRELKRVPLDFKWPENKVWEGYLNPHYDHNHQCHACNGHGSTMASQRLEDLISLLMLSGNDAKRGSCHPYFINAPLHKSQGKICGPDMIELTTALAGREPSFMGHDACDRLSARNKIIAAAGLPDDWGTCNVCEGSGTIWDSPEDEKAAEEWERTEPPIGDGFQIWETVSEGSPISPVFATPEELARYMTGSRWGGDKGCSYETWLNFINGPGWAPSMVIDGNSIKTGADAAF